MKALLVEQGWRSDRVTEAHLTDTCWQFLVRGLDDGRSVQKILEATYARLAKETLPTAERLLVDS